MPATKLQVSGAVNNMKSISLILVLIFAVLISTTGCSVNSAKREPPPSAPAQQTPTPNESPVEQVDIVEGETVAATEVPRKDHQKHRRQADEKAQLPEKQRRKIFTELVALELRGLTCAQACAVVAKKHGITPDAAFNISVEGPEKAWPMQ